MENFEGMFAEYLNGKRLKVTPQRKLIMAKFLGSKGHFSAEEIYSLMSEEKKSVGQATVYRTLKLLCEADIARELDFGDGVVRYELKYTNKHHDHLICEKCGYKVEVMDEQIEHLQENLAKSYGYILTAHSMNLYGICFSCQARNK